MSEALSEKEKDDKVKAYVPRVLEVGAGGIAQGFVDHGNATENDFELSPIVAEQSGVADIKRKELEDEVRRLVEEQRSQARAEGQEQGYQEGLELGKEEAFKRHEMEIRQQLGHLREMAKSFEEMKAQILSQSESTLMKMIFHLSKRLAQQQINVSSAGVQNLLHAIIQSSQADERFKVRLHPDDLNFINSVKATPGTQFDFDRLRLEADAKITRGGALIESNYSLIDATVEARTENVWQSVVQSLPNLASQKVDLTDSDDGDDDSDKS